MHVIYGRYMLALTNAQIMILHLRKCSHLDITSQTYQMLSNISVIYFRVCRISLKLVYYQ